MNHLYEQLTALKLTGFRDALKKQLAHPFTQSGKLVNPETKYFTDRGHRQR